MAMVSGDYRKSKDNIPHAPAARTEPEVTQSCNNNVPFLG
jgi:hypothetical protein